MSHFPVVLSLALALPVRADDPEPVPNPHADLVALPPEIDPGTGQRLFPCDIDGDHDPDLVLLADGTVYAVRMVDSLGSTQVMATGVTDACLVSGNGQERVASVKSTGLWTTLFDPDLGEAGEFESELLGEDDWQGALLVNARVSEDDPSEVDYVGVASDARTVLFATESVTGGLSATTEFTVATDIHEIFLLEWDGDTEQPEVAMLTDWGLQIHDPSAPLPALRKVRALGASFGIERVDLGPEDGVAWLTELPPTEFGTQRVLCLFSHYNPSYERVPPLSDAQTSLPFVDLVSGYYDGDADGDLLLLNSDGHGLKLLTNHAEQYPYPGAFTYDPNAPLDADLGQDLVGEVTGPFAWGPIYEGYPGPSRDYAALVSVGGAAKLRLLSGLPPTEWIQTVIDTPFSGIHVRAARIVQAELDDENAAADITFTLSDIWSSPPSSNAVEVILWRHLMTENGLEPYPVPLAVDRYICLRPWAGITFPAALETEERDPNIDWFTNAYYITAQRIQYVDGEIIRRWRKCVIGVTADGCRITNTLVALENLDDAGLTMVPITLEPDDVDCQIDNTGTGAGSVPQVRLPPANPAAPFKLPEATVLLPIPP